MDSIYKYMKLGIIHFKAYPEATSGEGHIVETLRKLVEDAIKVVVKAKMGAAQKEAAE